MGLFSTTTAIITVIVIETGCGLDGLPANWSIIAAASSSFTSLKYQAEAAGVP